MSKLLLTRHDVEKAIRQYFSDYERDLYNKYDFEKTDFYFEDRKLGYLDVKFVVSEREDTGVNAMAATRHLEATKPVESGKAQP